MSYSFFSYLKSKENEKVTFILLIQLSYKFTKYNWQNLWQNSPTGESVSGEHLSFRWISSEISPMARMLSAKRGIGEIRETHHRRPIPIPNGLGIVTPLIPWFPMRFPWYSWSFQDYQGIPVGFGISGILHFSWAVLHFVNSLTQYFCLFNIIMIPLFIISKKFSLDLWSFWRGLPFLL